MCVCVVRNREKPRKLERDQERERKKRATWRESARERDGKTAKDRE